MTVQLDQTGGGAPGRIWLFLDVDLQYSPSPTCAGATVTTYLGNFTSQAGRINPGGTITAGTVTGSWIHGGGATPAAPDFSGSRLTFGYLMESSGSTPGVTTSHRAGVDNFLVTVNCQ
jgi:hypothetical protein